MASNSKAVAAMILVNLTIFAFVSANATDTFELCPACMSLLRCGRAVTLDSYSQVGTPCCDLLGSLVATNAQVRICNAIVRSLLTVPAPAPAPALGLPLVGGLPGSTLSTADINKAVAILTNACNLPTFTCA